MTWLGVVTGWRRLSDLHGAEEGETAVIGLARRRRGKRGLLPYLLFSGPARGSLSLLDLDLATALLLANGLAHNLGENQLDTMDGRLEGRIDGGKGGLQCMAGDKSGEFA